MLKRFGLVMVVCSTALAGTINFAQCLVSQVLPNGGGLQTVTDNHEDPADTSCSLDTFGVQMQGHAFTDADGLHVTGSTAGIVLEHTPSVLSVGSQSITPITITERSDWLVTAHFIGNLSDANANGIGGFIVAQGPDGNQIRNNLATVNWVQTGHVDAEIKGLFMFRAGEVVKIVTAAGIAIDTGSTTADAFTTYATIEQVPLPEPATALLGLAGISIILCLRRARRRS